jgi:serine/threonine protein kinase
LNAFASKQRLFDRDHTLGPFQIEETMTKKGGMSELFVAHYQDNPACKVVLKLNRISEASGEGSRNIYQDLLRKEIRLLRELRHPGIVRIYPIAIESGSKLSYAARVAKDGIDLWYYAMEYLPGGSLEDNIHRISQMPLGWIIELFYQLLVTVQYLHRQEYAHCDLKPENILLRESPNPYRIPQPILIDFGCVERIDQLTEIPCATPSYSPPEVLLALQRVDIDPSDLNIKPAKIDIWSLGAILFALLTGKTMFAQRTLDEVTSSVIKGEIGKIQMFRPELHSSLDTLLTAMMRKEVEERADLDDVITAIEEKISSIRPPRIPTTP